MAGIITTTDAQAPPAQEVREVRMGDGQNFQVTIRTLRLTGGPYYLYQAYLNGEDQRPILELISNPGQEDLRDAIDRRKGGPK